MSLRPVLVPPAVLALLVGASCTSSITIADASGGSGTTSGTLAPSTKSGTEAPFTVSGSGTGSAASSTAQTTTTGAATSGTTVAAVSSSGGGAATTSGSVVSSTGAGTGGVPADDAGAGGRPLIGTGFHLLGLQSTGMAPLVELLDPTTGQGTVLGQLGQLGGWLPNVVLGHDGTRVFGVGNPYASSENVLVTLDLTTGTSSQIATSAPMEYVLAGVTDDEQVIGAYWTGAVEEIHLIDPVTGVGTRVGQLGDLASWPGELVYDHATHVVYVWGWNQANQSFLYSLDLDTQAEQQVPVTFGPNPRPFGGVTQQGNLVALACTGNVDLMQTVDPTQATFTTLGALPGGLDAPQWGSIAYDPTANVAYIAGATFGSPGMLLQTFDLATNTVTSTPVPVEYTLVRY